MEYQSNSNKSKRLSETRKSVAKGKIDESMPKKLVSLFLADDWDTIKDRIVNDIILPKVKELACNIVNEAVSTMFFGEAKHRGKSGTNNVIDYASYSRGSSNRNSNGSRSAELYKDVKFETRGEAEVTLELMNDILAEYGEVKVADLYEAAGITTKNWQFTQKFGWTDLGACHIDRLVDGYKLVMPKVKPLD